jgi:heme exporter protein D
MIEGGWAYIWGAYGLALAALVVLTLAVVLRLAHWSTRARGLERKS